MYLFYIIRLLIYYAHKSTNVVNIAPLSGRTADSRNLRVFRFCLDCILYPYFFNGTGLKVIIKGMVVGGGPPSYYKIPLDPTSPKLLTFLLLRIAR